MLLPLEKILPGLGAVAVISPLVPITSKGSDRTLVKSFIPVISFRIPRAAR